MPGILILHVIVIAVQGAGVGQRVENPDDPPDHIVHDAAPRSSHQRAEHDRTS
jgi:hypothetical protein